MKRRTNGAGRPRLETGRGDAELKMRAAALDLFAARNFSAVTIKDIAKVTGFNTALIYYYFGSKEDLFRSAVSLAVERAFHEFRRSREGAKRPREIILEWLETHIREFETISKLIKISIDYAATADRKPGIDRAIRRFYDEERDVLREALRAGVASRDFANVNVDEMATFISTYLDGIFVRAMMLRDFAPVEAIRELKSLLFKRLRRSKQQSHGAFLVS